MLFPIVRCVSFVCDPVVCLEKNMFFRANLRAGLKNLFRFILILFCVYRSSANFAQSLAAKSEILDHDFTQAAKLLESEVLKSPENPDLQMYFGQALYGAASYARAADVYDQAAKLYEDSELKKWALFNRAGSLAMAGNLKNAIKQYEFLLASHPDFKEAQENLEYLKNLKNKDQESPQDSGANGEDEKQSQNSKNDPSQSSNEQQNGQNQKEQSSKDAQKSKEDQQNKQEQQNGGEDQAIKQGQSDKSQSTQEKLENKDKEEKMEKGDSKEVNKGEGKEKAEAQIATEKQKDKNSDGAEKDEEFIKNNESKEETASEAEKRLQVIEARKMINGVPDVAEEYRGGFLSERFKQSGSRRSKENKK